MKKDIGLLLVQLNMKVKMVKTDGTEEIIEEVKHEALDS